MTRNVANVPEVESFLHSRLDRNTKKTVRRWFTSVAKRWILRHYSQAWEILECKPSRIGGYFSLVFRTPSGRLERRMAPEGCFVPGLVLPGCHYLVLQNGWHRDTLTLKADLALLKDYFAVLDERRLRKLERMSFPGACRAAKAWLDEVRCRSNWEESLLPFCDGYSFQVLSDDWQLHGEGAAMGNCAGSYAEKVEEGETEILSLRDSKGRPHVMVEVQNGYQVVQALGRANERVASKYRPYLSRLVEELDLFVPSSPYAGERYRESFDPRSGESWYAEENLRARLHSLSPEARDLREDLISDIAAALHNGEKLDWDWLDSLWLSEAGEPIWSRCEKRVELAGADFELSHFRHCGDYAWMLAHSRAPVQRRRGAAWQEEIEQRLVDFLLRDERTVLRRASLPYLKAVEVRPLLTRHRTRLREALARSRRQLRRWRREKLLSDDEGRRQKEGWRTLADRLHREEALYV
jgi:hypothetical protein